LLPLHAEQAPKLLHVEHFHGRLRHVSSRELRLRTNKKRPQSFTDRGRL
jgi:hypothetical protein